VLLPVAEVRRPFVEANKSEQVLTVGEVGGGRSSSAAVARLVSGREAAAGIEGGLQLLRRAHVAVGAARVPEVLLEMNRAKKCLLPCYRRFLLRPVQTKRATLEQNGFSLSWRSVHRHVRTYQEELVQVLGRHHLVAGGREDDRQQRRRLHVRNCTRQQTDEITYSESLGDKTTSYTTY
jgi:hypothetical protein